MVGVEVGSGGVGGIDIVVGIGVAVGLPVPPPLLGVAVAVSEGVCGATVSSAVAEGNSGVTVGGASAEASRLPSAIPTTKRVRKMTSSAPAIANSAIRPPIRESSGTGSGAVSMGQPSSITALLLREYARK
jgi:hypothetical protein